MVQTSLRKSETSDREGIVDHTKREAVCLELVSDLPAPHVPSTLQEAINLKSSRPGAAGLVGTAGLCV